MDNIAHALTGAIVAKAVAPEIEKPFSRKLMFSGMALANLPDIDLLLGLFGREIYRYHHRGFTHSFVGLIMMIPIGLLLFRIIMGKDFFEQYKKFSFKKQFFLVALQLVFGHFFLDYLTSFGTMLLYPLTMSRFSYPLMFIIDPLFWLITAIGCGACYAVNWKDKNQKLTCALVSMAFIFTLWGLEWSFKLRSHFLVRKAQEQVISFPMPLAPVLWNVLVKTDQAYKQYTISFKSPTAPKILEHPLPGLESLDNECSNITGEKNRAHVDYYFSFAELPYCRTIPDGCNCISLKYSIPALGKGAFGEQNFVQTPAGFKKYGGRGRRSLDRLKKLF